MARAKLTPAVTVEELEDREDGGLQATVVFSRRRATLLRKAGGDNLATVLADAIQEAVDQMPNQLKRIVAHVPEALVASFDRYCEEVGINKSRALLGRVSRYVDEEGEILIKSYGNKTPIPTPSQRKVRRVVQILVPPAQAEGFDRFCKKVGIQKDTFMMREMARFLDRAAKAQETAAGTNGSEVPARSD
jgi:hypothetical protein